MPLRKLIALGILLLVWYGGIAEPSGTDHTSMQERLVALLYLRKDNLRGTVRGEIYPLAVIRGGTYRDASVSTIGDDSLQGKTMALDRFRIFTVYYQGKPIGRFEVSAVREARFSCMTELVGTGRLELPAAYQRFDLKNPRVTRSQGYDRKKSFDDTLIYYLATSPSLAPASFEEERGDPRLIRGRIITRLRQLAAQFYARYRPHWDRELKRFQPKLEELRVFDLDRDGKLEVMARFIMRIKLGAAVDLSDDRENGSVTTQEVRLMLWVRDHGPNLPLEELWVQHDVLQEGSWGSGHQLIEVADLDGDGTAEVLLKIGGWETTDFVVYAVRGGKLESVFRGAGYGC